MYIRSDGRRHVSVPQNYSGSLFSDPPHEAEIDKEIEAGTEEIEASASPEPIPVSLPKKDFLSNILDNEELIILGLILLLSQDGFGDDIIPILLIILFFKK